MAVATGAKAQRILTANFLWICFASFGAIGSFGLLLASLPIYIKRIGGNGSEIGVVLGTFTVTAVAVRPFVGARADQRGKKGLMLVGIVLLAASTVLYLGAQSIALLFLLRIVQGVAWGIFSTCCTALVADVVPPQRRGEAMGYYGVFGNLAMAAGPLVGVLIAGSSAGFALLFLVAAGVASLGLVGTLGARDVLAPRVASPAPLRARLFNREALYPSVILVFYALSYGSIISFLALFAEEREMGNPGYFFAVFSVVTIVARGPVGRLSDMHGRLAVVVPSLVASAASLALLARADSLGELLLVAVLYGLSTAAVIPALMALVGDRIVQAESGSAMGTFATAMDLGLGIGTIISGVVAQISGYGTMFLVAAATTLLGLVAIFVGRIHRL